MTKPDLKIVVGLGNPGESYRRTYHNVGRLAVEHLARAKNLGPFSRRVRDGFEHLRADSLLLVLPLAFMNESGRAVKKAVAFFKVKPREVLVVHDEGDLPLGSWKLSFGRGPAGHHGVESVIEHLGTKEFWRLRIGIRKAGTPAKPKRPRAEAFVLQKILPEDMKTLQGVFGATIEKLIENERPAGVGRISESGSVTP